MNRLSHDRWVADQYRNASNLTARIQLHVRYGTNPYPWPRWVFDRFSFVPAAHILEVGCGPGTLWWENSDRATLGTPKAAPGGLPARRAPWSLYLTDLSPGMVAQAKHNLRAVRCARRYGVCDAQTLPFADDSFDGVVANHMLYHVPDLELALAEIRRVLRPDGRLFAATNGARHMHQYRQLVQQIATAEGGAGAAWPQSHFAFESGKEALNARFQEVTLYRYKNRLDVTEVEPLVQYALSMDIIHWTEARGTAFRAAVAREIAAQGKFEITTETGLFEAAGVK